MARSLTRSHILVLPLVLLVVILFEEIAAYQLRLRVSNVYARTAAMMVLYGVGFAFAATQVSPRLKRLLLRLRQTSRRGAGSFGTWAFFAAGYGLLFYAYLLLETQGPGALLPATWR